jgi:hypothetical protein
MKKQYYGEKEVDQVVGGELISVLKFKDGTEESITNKMLDGGVLTEKAVDATTLRDLRIKPMVKDILSVMLYWDIKVPEVEYAFATAIASINQSMKAGNAYLWGVDDMNKKFSQIDKVLREYATKEEADKPKQ